MTHHSSVQVTLVRGDVVLRCLDEALERAVGEHDFVAQWFGVGVACV
ncbi:hypothetical protein ACIPC1_19475 [Streptomyces sp. NPDC087263]